MRLTVEIATGYREAFFGCLRIFGVLVDVVQTLRGSSDDLGLAAFV
jgi:hypothetical protein